MFAMFGKFDLLKAISSAIDDIERWLGKSAQLG
jgi:hypothetical protein